MVTRNMIRVGIRVFYDNAEEPIPNPWKGEIVEINAYRGVTVLLLCIFLYGLKSILNIWMRRVVHLG